MNRKKFILAAFAMLFCAATRLQAAPDTVNLYIEDTDLNGANGVQLNAGRELSSGATFFITPGLQIQPGGQISIQIPSNWSMPGTGYSDMCGYVNVFSTSAAQLSATTTGYIIVVQISTMAPVNSGEVVLVTYNRPWIQWNAQDDVAIPVRVKHSMAATFVNVDPCPSVDVVAGPPANVTYDTWGLVVEKGKPSNTPVKVRLVDNAWITTKATAPVTVSLQGLVYDNNTYTYVQDPTAAFSLTSVFSSTTTELSIVSGTSGAEFYYRTSTSAASTIIRVTSSLSPSYNDMWVNVINGGFTNAKIHKGDYTSNSSVTLNVNETAYIDFNFNNANTSWQVLISSSPDRSAPIWTYWGWGAPVPGQVTWNGYMSYYDNGMNYWRNERAKKGTYYVRIQTSGGGICDDTLQLTLQSLDISGYVADADGNRIPGVSVNCYGPSYAYTTTDSTGHYVLSGLVAGSYNINFNKSGYSWQGINGVNAGESRNVVLKQPAYLRINAHRGVSTDTANAECWGNVQLIPRDGSSTPYWSSLHFAVGVSTSDNGMWTYDSSVKRYEIDNSTAMIWEAGKWSTLDVVPGSYTLRAEMYGYDVIERTFNLSTSTFISDIVFTPRTAVMGTIQLASPSKETGAGTWVSVEAIPAGSQNGTAWGGTSIPYNGSTGTYTVNGLASGNYTLRLFAQGYRRGTVAVTVPQGATFISVPTVTLSETGGISGTVTVEGDTTDPALSSTLTGDPFSVNLNAWSSDSYGYGWTQALIGKNLVSATTAFSMRGLDDGTYWINSWLQGFELQNATGWNGVRVVVSGGSGTVNLKFKRYSARIRCTFAVPDNDYDRLKISVSGTNIYAENVTMAAILSGVNSYGITFDTHTGIMTTPPLATGFFQLKGEYTGTGLARTKQVMTVNGQTSNLTMDLTAQTCTISGTVSISASNPPQGFTDMALLVASAPVNNMTWDSALGISTTSLRVKAVDYSKMLNNVSGTAAGIDTGAKSGVVNADGSFVIPGIVPGVYLLKIPALELDGNTNNGKETADSEKMIYVSGNVNNNSLEISKGYSVKGQVKLPDGETANRSFDISIYKPVAHDKQFVGYGRAQFNNASSGEYEIKGLASGNYILTINDWGYSDSATGMWMPRQYASSSVNIKVESADLNGQNIQLGKGGTIIFKLRDADSGTVITWANKDKMLPASFSVTGEANPWVEGGWISMNSGSVTDGGNGSFAIKFLPEASYELTFGKSSKDYSNTSNVMNNTAGNQATYANKVVSGIKVRNGQAVDMGTVDIKQGLTITGIVTDKNGNPLPNIPVVAIPSLTTEWSSQLNSFTDANGKYSVAGLNTDYPYYDLIACPRVGSQYLGGINYFYGTGGVTYGEKTKAMIKIKDGPAVNFVLEEAKGSVSGKVVTEDGGAFQSMNDPNIPEAMVLMQRENTVPRSNPIGDIETSTAYDGSFTVEALSPGTYNLAVLSGGYLSASRSVTVGSAGVDLGTITLRRGAKVSGAIAGVDGKNPSSSEISVIAAANDDFSEVVIGTLKKSGAMTVAGYELTGFQTGTSYNIMFFGESGADAIPALSGYSVPFTTYTKTDLDLVYKIAEPSIISRVTRDGNRYTIYFELSGALRKSLPADELDSVANPGQTIVTVTAGKASSLEYPYMSPDRKRIVCVYTAAAGDTGFTLRLHAFAKAVNPATGTEFEVDEQFQYYAGIAAKNRARVSNLKGGKITLEGDPSYVQFTPGTFEVGGSTSSVYVDFSRADSVGDFQAQASVRGAPSLTIARAPEAYPSRLYAAMKMAQSAGVSAFSAFYDVMLPQGVSRTLKKDAMLTLQYSGSVDPSTLNIYYYDQTNNVYLLENRSRSVDTDAGTISIGVNHASVFVILQANASVIQGSTYDGPLFVYNFPNPFNLNAKTVALTHPTQSRAITGTMLHYGLPSSTGGEVEVRIYNVAGELVRTINDGVKAGGYHYYSEWDGTNDSGKKVASGVYIARFTVDKKHEKFFKMAIIK